MHCKYIVMHLALYKCHGVAGQTRPVLLGLTAHIRAQQSIYNITSGWSPFEGEVKHIKAIFPYPRMGTADELAIITGVAARAKKVYDCVCLSHAGEDIILPFPASLLKRTAAGSAWLKRASRERLSGRYKPVEQCTTMSGNAYDCRQRPPPATGMSQINFMMIKPMHADVLTCTGNSKRRTSGSEFDFTLGDIAGMRDAQPAQKTAKASRQSVPAMTGKHHHTRQRAAAAKGMP
jgi:hypothetical protein